MKKFKSLFALITLFLSILFVNSAFSKEPASIEDEYKSSPAGLTGIELKELEEGKKEKPHRLIIPPYFSEKTKNTTFKTVLPLYYHKVRKGEGASEDLGILPFYWAHDSLKLHTRVYFPFYWKIRSPESKTDVVLISHYNRARDYFNFGISPLFYFGKNKKTEKSYQIILPPLFWNFKNHDGGLTYSLLYYNYRKKLDYKRGFIPLYFSARKNDRSITTVLPPLFWYINDAINYKTTVVLPPLFLKLRENGWSAGLLPVFYFARDKNWSRNMVMPFYYGSRVNELKSHYFPFLLSYWRNSPTLKQGGVAIFYHWYKHEGKYLNMYSPLLWRWGNTRTLTKNLMLPPLFYRGKSPVSSDTMLGLVYWNFNDFHLKKTTAIMPLFAHQKNLRKDSTRTWVFPTFDFEFSKKGFHTWMHPLVYVGKDKDKKHLVLNPILWHFENKKRDSTVVFPLWWQFHKKNINKHTLVAFPLWWQFDNYKKHTYNKVLFPFYWDFKNNDKKKRTIVTFPPFFWKSSDSSSSRTGVLNVSLHKGVDHGNKFWTFNIFPLLLFGKPPAEEGARWEILHGLIGWRRQGSTKQFKFLWIPFTSSK